VSLGNHGQQPRWRESYAAENPLQRITLNPAVCPGRPTIRNMRFTVAQLLELLAGGMRAAEVPGDYPFLEIKDVEACLAYKRTATQ